MTQAKERYSQKKALASEPDWSHFQAAVFDRVVSRMEAIKSGETLGAIAVKVGAVAGSGKSTVIRGIVNRTDSKVKARIVAFNAHIAQALSVGMPTRVDASTTHAIGMGLIIRHFKSTGDTVRPEVDEGKARNICKKIVSEIDLSKFPKDLKEVRRDLTGFMANLMNFCRMTLREPTPENLRGLVDFYGIETVDGWELAIDLIPIALDEDERIAVTKGIVDFGDQLWLPHVWELYPMSCDFVLADEFQDMNEAQLQLIKKLVGDRGMLIALGDERQSVMAFSGASPDMWHRISSLMPTEELPLSICYRCPTSHLDLARSIVPQIQARDNAPEGTIEIIHPSEVKSKVQAGDLVICRFTAPLISLCLKLIVSGTEAKIRGRDIGAQLTSLVRQASCTNLNELPYMLGAIVSPQVEEYREAGKDAAADNLSDRFSAIMACYNEFGESCGRSVERFCERIKGLFSDDKVPVVLSTIHRAKGDESDRVWLLGCNQLPYVAKATHDWQAEQEENLLYVALTRAKQSLFLVPLLKDDKALKGDQASKTQKLDELCRHPYGGLEIAPVPFGSQIEAIATPVIETVKPTKPPSYGDRLPNQTLRPGSSVRRTLAPDMTNGGKLRKCSGWIGEVMSVNGGTAEVWWVGESGTTTMDIAHLEAIVPMKYFKSRIVEVKGAIEVEVGRQMEAIG